MSPVLLSVIFDSLDIIAILPYARIVLPFIKYSPPDSSLSFQPERSTASAVGL